jgi:hypothetical protein
MKTTNVLLILILLLFASSAFGQAEENKEEIQTSYNLGTHNDFMIDLGMNNYLEDGKSPDSNAPYAVKPWGSWYIALKSINDTHIGGKLHLLWGGDVSWYTFKFENPSVRLVQGEENLIFMSEDISNAHKSKLNVSYLNVSVVPMLRFGKKHGHKWYDHDDHFSMSMGRTGGFRIGLGGYAGYRLGSKTKSVIKEGGDKDKNKDHENYYLNDWRYGVRLQAGVGSFDAFINYDLNDLFRDNKGPALNAISFGIIL